jgi:hypothetical protein
MDEEQLLAKIKRGCIDWDKTFIFGRGVEISKKEKLRFVPLAVVHRVIRKHNLRKEKKNVFSAKKIFH